MPDHQPPHPVVDEELGLLAQVTAVLAAPPSPAPPAEASVIRDLERLREMLAEGEKLEDHAALMQQWNRQTALLRQLREARQAPQVSRDSPYFAHLRLAEKGEEHDILLGKGTRLERGVHIVDWRNAPISRLFYRYRQGDEYEEEIAGRERVGTVAVRRTVAIRDLQLERVEAPEGVFVRDADARGGWRHAAAERPRLAGGEGSALRAHEVGRGRARRLGTDPTGVRRRIDKHLPDIAGLIDPEQFALITRPSSGFVVVRGTAGSGKTTVALHRVAYLAYDDPTIDSDRTLVVVFSPALRDYVAHVLPALGVTHVQVRTFQEWAADAVRRLLPALPERVREDTPALVQRAKVHPAFLALLEGHVAAIAGAREPAQVVDDWLSVLGSGARLEAALAEGASDAFSAAERRRAADACRAQAERVAAWLEGDRAADAELDPEDHALLLRAWQLRIGALTGRGGRPLRYRHVVVDEVQDFSPVDVRVLLECLDERRSITLAGDTQQHVAESGGFTSWTRFFADLGLDGTTVDTLEVSYRCSQEVAGFALGVLGDLREDETPPRTTRSGPPVELFRFTDHGACVAFLADALQDLLEKERVASVAVLTPSRELSALYHRGLVQSEVPRVHRVEHYDFSFAPGIEVTEIEQAKGLEFDYVILVEVSAAQFPDRPGARRLLHVGATRAVHQLWMTSVGTPSPIVHAPLATAGR